VFDLSLELFCVVNPGGFFNYASPEFARTLGYSGQELTGRRVRDFVHPDDTERVLAAARELVRSGKEFRAETRWLGRDGSARWLQWTALFDPGSRLIYAVSRDVTESLGRKERTALRLVATLVAQGTPPAKVFDAIAEQMRRLFQVESAILVRFDDDGLSTVMAHSLGQDTPLAAGTRLPIRNTGATAELRRTRRPARRDGITDLPGRSGPLADVARSLGITGAANAPIVVEGRVWGYTGIMWREPPFPDIEARMVRFTELAGTAIADADSRAQLDLSRIRLAQVAAEQAALRRVAMLVATGASTTEVFEAVTTEMRKLLRIEGAVLQRFQADGTATIIAISDPKHIIAADDPLGARVSTEGTSLVSRVRRVGGPVLAGSYDGTGQYVPSLGGAGVTGTGVIGAVGVPVMVEGRPWGMAAVAWRDPVAGDTGSRLSQFTELLGAAIANADGREQLEASRARVVTAADHAQRRIERNLHDGVQQQLIALILDLRELEVVSPGPNGEVARIAGRLGLVLEELREIARGLQPPVLRLGGLGPALRALARRSRIPVQLRTRVQGRLPEGAEVAAYHVVAETLANAAKYSKASAIQVKAQVRGDVLLLSVRDDGLGGAEPAKGTGLIGLKDRVEAIGGTLTVNSPPGAGTMVSAAIPLNSPAD
jgi:PAS domain S-box-containing protein